MYCSGCRITPGNPPKTKPETQRANRPHRVDFCDSLRNLLVYRAGLLLKSPFTAEAQSTQREEWESGRCKAEFIRSGSPTLPLSHSSTLLSVCSAPPR